MITQNVGHSMPCKLEFRTKMGVTPRLSPVNKARVGRSERSTVKCSATSSSSKPNNQNVADPKTLVACEVGSAVGTTGRQRLIGAANLGALGSDRIYSHP